MILFLRGTLALFSFSIAAIGLWVTMTPGAFQAQPNTGLGIMIFAVIIMGMSHHFKE